MFRDLFADVARQLEELLSELNHGSYPALRRRMPAPYAAADRRGRQISGDETAGKEIRQICQMKRVTQ